jgi:hypothetical protein
MNLTKKNSSVNFIPFAPSIIANFCIEFFSLLIEGGNLIYTIDFFCPCCWQMADRRWITSGARRLSTQHLKGWDNLCNMSAQFLPRMLPFFAHAAYA